MTKFVVFAFACLLAACSSKATPTVASSSPSATADLGAEPVSAQQLKAAAQVHFNSYGTGDWAAVWDDLDAPSKAVVTRAEYVRRLTECSRYDPNRGKPATVEGVVDNHDGTWSVIVRIANLRLTFPARYESGHWRFVLPPPSRAAMRLRFDRYIATQCRR
jgi:hypothetical protein